MVQLFRPGPEGRHTPGLLTEIVCLPAVPALIIGNHLRRRSLATSTCMCLTTPKVPISHCDREATQFGQEGLGLFHL